MSLFATASLCKTKDAFVKEHGAATIEPHPWGTGQELRIPAQRSPSKSDESYFFDEDGRLVGSLFTFVPALDLDPYPVLRRTLSQLKPTLEFYLSLANLTTRTDTEASSLYATGEEKTTIHYLVVGDRERPRLLQASFTIDPYAKLFSPYRKEFLSRLRNSPALPDTQRIESQGTEDTEPFASLQQFARGQTAQLGYCGAHDADIALDAFQKAMAVGFSNKVWQAEVHHRLGLAWEAKGQFDKAKAEMLQSLSIRPNIPEVLNNLGTVHRKLGDSKAAIELFEKAIIIRPNYAIARYNLAEAYEPTNPKRSISEYETYLVLVEGIPEESDRSAVAQARVKALKQR